MRENAMSDPVDIQHVARIEAARLAILDDTDLDLSATLIESLCDLLTGERNADVLFALCFAMANTCRNDFDLSVMARIVKDIMEGDPYRR